MSAYDYVGGILNKDVVAWANSSHLPQVSKEFCQQKSGKPNDPPFRTLHKITAFSES